VPSIAILHETQQLHSVSDRLDLLASELPLVLTSIHLDLVPNTATLLEVLVATKMALRSGSDPANA